MRSCNKLYFVVVFITSCCAACQVGLSCSLPAVGPIHPTVVPQPNAVVYNPNYNVNHVPMQQVPASVVVTTDYLHGTQEEQNATYAQPPAYTTEVPTETNHDTETKSMDTTGEQSY